MPICHNPKYSVLTQKPHDKDEKQLFWEFRCEDIISMFRFKCFYAPFLTLMTLQYYKEPAFLNVIVTIILY